MLKIVNTYSTTMQTAIEFRRPGCPDGGDWEKKGWWVIDPGSSAVVWGGDVSDVNRYWLYYAEAWDGATWAGPYTETLPHQRFDWCKNTSSTDSRTVGMRLLDIGSSDNFTLTLHA